VYFTSILQKRQGFLTLDTKSSTNYTARMIICIIGGGVVGLNIALHFAETNLSDSIFLLEQEQYLGHHTSSRNSEVIHAGFSYPPNSLKTKLCIEGNRLTYDLLNQLNVPYKKCGKWIVAVNDAESDALQNAKQNADEVGVAEFDFVDVETFYKEEPDTHNIQSVIFSGTSGLMDCSEYICALEKKCATLPNCEVIYPCKVNSINGNQIDTDRGDIETELIINSAGLEAHLIYKMTGGARNFETIPFKGEYYSWPKGTIKTMIYPAPKSFQNKTDPTMVSNMGIHVHRNMAGDLITSNRVCGQSTETL
jgi:L-2-hydroxyglutarate oxidase LhgO